MKKFLTFTSLLVLVSCTSMSGTDGKPLARSTFAHLDKLFLNVHSVNTIDDTFANGSSAVPEHFYIPVRDMFNDYVDARFHASGMGEHIVDIQLETYDVSYQQNESENGMAKFVGVANMDQYTVDVSVNLTLSNPATGEMKGRRLNLRRVMNISEHVSIAEREKHQMEGIEQMFAELDEGIVEVMRTDFALSF